jgi:hypothetical protein
MNLKEIKKVLEYNIPDETKRTLIIRILSEDKNVIPTIMEILDYERQKKAELIGEMNMQLSRAHIGLDNPKMNKDKFIQKEITQFYLKNEDQVGHCFKDLSKEKLIEEDTL